MFKSKNVSMSVIIPTYNNGEMLKATLESLNWQTFKDFEVIVINDGSTDNTEEIVKSFKSNYPLVYLYQEDLGRRVVKARNDGIKKAKGEIIFFLDDTVIIKSDVLQIHWDKHQRKDNIYVQTSAMWFQEKVITYDFINKGFLDDYLEVHPDICHVKGWIKGIYDDPKMQYEFTSMGTNCCSVKKKHIDKIGLFDDQFEYQWGDEDTDYGERLKDIGIEQLWSMSYAYHNKHTVDITEQTSIVNRIKLMLKHPRLTKYRHYCGGKNLFYGYTEPSLRGLLKDYTNGLVRCYVCGKTFSEITESHLKKHNLTMEDYLKFGYPEPPIKSFYRRESPIVNKNLCSYESNKIQVSIIIENKNLNKKILKKIDQLDFPKHKFEVLSSTRDESLYEEIKNYDFLVKLYDYQEPLIDRVSNKSFVLVHLEEEKELEKNSIKELMKKVKYGQKNYVGDNFDKLQRLR